MGLLADDPGNVVTIVLDVGQDPVAKREHYTGARHDDDKYAPGNDTIDPVRAGTHTLEPEGSCHVLPDKLKNAIVSQGFTYSTPIFGCNPITPPDLKPLTT